MKITERLLAHKKTWLLLAVCWTATVTYFCLKDGIKLPSILPKGADKIGHVCFHIGMVVTWFVFLKSINLQKKTKFVLRNSVLTSVIFGVMLEICQETFTKTRTADLRDVCANAVGAIIGAIIIVFTKKYLLKMI